MKMVRPVGGMDGDIDHLLKLSVVGGTKDDPMAESNKNRAFGDGCSVDCWVRKGKERYRVPVEGL